MLRTDTSQVKSRESFMNITVGYLLMMDSVSTEGLQGFAVNKKQAILRSIRRASFTTLTTRLSSL